MNAYDIGRKHPLERDFHRVLLALTDAKLEGLGYRDLTIERDPCSDALIIKFRLLAPESFPEPPRRRFEVK